MHDDRGQRFEHRRRNLNLAVALLSVAGVILLVGALWLERYDPVLTEIVSHNFPAVIGLPMAAIAAFIVVAFFRQDERPLEFEGFGFKFRGASGEIVLWIACFALLEPALQLVATYAPPVAVSVAILSIKVPEVLAVSKV